MWLEGRVEKDADGVTRDEIEDVRKLGQIMKGFENRTRTLNFILRIMRSLRGLKQVKGGVRCIVGLL